MSQQYFTGSSLRVLKLFGFAGELCSSLWFYFPAAAQFTSVEQNKKHKGCLQVYICVPLCVCVLFYGIYTSVRVQHSVGGQEMRWTNLWGSESVCVCVETLCVHLIMHNPVCPSCSGGEMPFLRCLVMF